MRLLAFALLFSALAGGAAVADDASVRRDWIEGMRRGFSDKAQGTGAPNVIDLLETRFPDDLNRFADKFIAQQKSGNPITPSQINIGVARMFVEVQSREADHMMTAPVESLKAVLEAQRELLQAASRDQPQLCVIMATDSEARPSPTQEIGRLSVMRLAALLTALADGRDKPVGARSATDADWEALGTDAVKRGYDVKSWAVLVPDKAKSSPAFGVCAALLSSTQAILTTDGELGERLLASQAHSLLAVDTAVYRRLQ
jgi:hypothetical protein